MKTPAGGEKASVRKLKTHITVDVLIKIPGMVFVISFQLWKLGRLSAHIMAQQLADPYLAAKEEDICFLQPAFLL